MRRLINRLIAIILLLTALLAIAQTGCQSPGTAGTSPASQSPATSGSGSPTAGTSGSTALTSGPAVSETTAAATSVLPAADFHYQALAADREHQIDLDGDQKMETIRLTRLNSNHVQIFLNGAKTDVSGEELLGSWFFLIDLDARDPWLDLAVQELGPSNDEFVHFYYYDGKQLIARGTIPGMICDPYSDAIGREPFGLGTIHPDGLGSLVTRARGMILHTWFYDEPWTIAADRKLQPVAQDYYAMMAYDQETGKRLQETPVKMRLVLPLLSQPGSNQVVASAKTGESVSLVQTDNKAWIQMRTQSGQLGWFHVIDYYQIKIDGQQYFSDEVFEGLSLAD